MLHPPIQKLLTSSQMRTAEKLAAPLAPIPDGFEWLMENAGRAAAEAIERRYSDRFQNERTCRMVILLGKGNNGGDGLVIARVLLEKYPGLSVTLLFCMGHTLSPLAQLNLDRLEKISGWKSADATETDLPALFGDSVFILDGIFGTGFHGQLPEPLVPILRAANGSPAVRIALDIPTGVNGDNGLSDPDAFHAEYTCAFAAYKPAHFLKSSRYLCGETERLSIGIPDDILNAVPDTVSLLTEKDAASLLPPRRPDSNKGSYGRLLLIGGCRTMTGAVLLPASAAARSGVGLVMTAAPENALVPIRSSLPEALQLPLPLHSSGAIDPAAAETLLEKENGWASAVLCGCGMSLTEETKEIVSALLQKCEKPLVLDADGLNALSALGTDALLSAKAPVILTPHMMEFSRLTGKTIAEIQEKRFPIARAFAQKYRVTLALKDASTLIVSPDGEMVMNQNGNPGLSKGGSGDTLAGIIASLLAQGSSPFDAAALGVWLHAEAGDFAEKEKTAYAMLPQDVIRSLPAAFSKLLSL